MKRFLFIVLAVTLGFISLFNLNFSSKSLLSSSAYNNTYNYTAEIQSDFSNVGDYAITDVKSYTSNGQPVFKISLINTDNTNHSLFYLYTGGNYSSQYSNFDWFYYNHNEVNFCVIKTGGTLQGYRSGTTIGVFIGANSSCDIYISNLYFSGVFNNQPTFTGGRNSYVSNNAGRDTSALVDMNPDTNLLIASFSYNSFIGGIVGDIPSLALQDVASYCFNEFDSIENISITSSSSYHLYCSSGIFETNCQLRSIQISQFFESMNQSTVVGSNNGFNLLIYSNGFDIQVYRPVRRVSNTLILYTFNFPNVVSKINNVYYSLSRGDDLYVVNYSGPIPNKYYNYIFNNEIQNTLFDEYIDVSFTFNSLLNASDNVTYVNFAGVEESCYGLLAGFDFNFTYYASPLVSSNGIYNYTFNKPCYVAMEFSLYPFYIPILEAVENALIFLLFYCPIISDILNLLHLSEFLGGLITIINYYTTGVLGNFLTALISFFIFYFFFKSVMPTVSTGLGSMIDNSQIGYNKRRNKELKKLYREQQQEVKYTQSALKHEERRKKKK